MMRGGHVCGAIVGFLAVLAFGCRDSGHPLGSTGAAGRGGAGGTSSMAGAGGAAGTGGTSSMAGAGGAAGAGDAAGAGGAGMAGAVAGSGGGASGGGAGRGGTTGGAGGAAGRGGTGGAAGAGGTGGAATCGGSTSIPCPTGQVCDYNTPDRCGSGSVTGRCIVPPDGCLTVFDPVCGCDGQTYPTDCDRARARVQLDHAGACGGAGGGGGAGGTGGATSCAACDPTTTYCRTQGGGIPSSTVSYSCSAFPAGCGGTPSCACLPTASCSGICETGSGGLLILNCAGA
jgi:hypothetical protein